MSATVITLVEERRHKKRLERLTRQVERDLERVLSLLKHSAQKSPEVHTQPA